MCKWMVAAMSIVLATGVIVGAPLDAEEQQRQEAALAQLDADLTKASTEDQRTAILRRAMKDEVSRMKDDINPEMRRQILLRAELLTSPGQEDWLIERLRDEPDFLLRQVIASLLGKTGSPRVVATLIIAARSDPKTFGRAGCIRLEGTVRRQAMFALAELGNRLPDQRQRIVDALRAMPWPDDKADLEYLDDVRLQSLYQLTGENELLKVFFQRLASDNSKDRVRGVVAFRFLKLRKAPTELVARLEDANEEVRMWAAFVLGEIGDSVTVPALMATAENKKLDRATRASAIASLGKMNAKAAMELMKRLSKDKNDTIAPQATAALNAFQTAETHPVATSKPAE